MAAPAAPTLTTLTTEAWKKALNGATPSAAQLTRSQDEWMEEVKNDIWHRAKRLRSLQVTSVTVCVDGQSRYSMPSDFSTLMTAELLDGANTGTAQDGAAGSLTLAAADSFTENDLQGKDLLITSGTGVGSASQITAYNNGTKVASVTPNFTTAPATASTYRIIDLVRELAIRPAWEHARLHTPQTAGRPVTLFETGDQDYGEVFLHPTPEKTYGLRLRYYANLLTSDLAGTTIATVYQRWRTLWVQGVYFKALQSLADPRWTHEWTVYQRMLLDLLAREEYGTALSTLQAQVTG
jgi:hypothetical protein